MPWSGYRGDTKLIGMLLAHGSSANITNFRGWTPLHTAAIRGRPEVVALLLEAGANRNIRGEHNLSPLDIAKAKDIREIVELFQARGIGDDILAFISSLHCLCFVMILSGFAFVCFAFISASQRRRWFTWPGWSTWPRRAHRY
jgi:ankyrin repeat protein